VVEGGSTWDENDTVTVPRKYSMPTVPELPTSTDPPVAGMLLVAGTHQWDEVVSVVADPPKPMPPKLVMYVVPWVEAVVFILAGPLVAQLPNATSPFKVELATKKLEANSEMPSFDGVATFVPFGVINAYASKMKVSDCACAGVMLIDRGVAAL
jgi:hypothetical protein